MKRAILTLVAALLVVVAAMPYWFGVEAERIYNEQLGLLDTTTDLTVVDNTFTRGWFSSSAQTTLSVADAQVRIIAEHTIEHGPIPISDPSKYLLSLRPLQALIRSRLSVLDLSGTELSNGHLLTEVNIDATTRSQVNIPHTRVQLDAATELVSGPVSGHVDFEPAEATWRGVLNFSGSSWRQSETRVETGPGILNFLAYSGSTGLALGDSTFEFDSIEAHFAGIEHPVIADGISVRSVAKEQAQVVSYLIDGSVESAGFDDIRVAPGSWNLSAGHLDLASLTRLNGADIDSALPLNDLIGLVTKQNASFRAALNFNTNSGPITGNANLSLQGSDGSANVLLLIGGLMGRMDLNIPGQVVERAARAALQRDPVGPAADPAWDAMTSQQQNEAMDNAVAVTIQSWVDNNFFTRAGPNYRFEASIDKGAIRLNNKPVDLLSLFR